MIAAKTMILDFREAYMGGYGYIYGKKHEMWSEAKQAEYRNVYLSDPERYADRKTSAEKGGKWVGHYVTDCSGMFAYSASKHGGYLPHGSNKIWNEYCTSKGTLKSGKRTDGKTLLPGTAVFTSSGDRHNHIGLFVGDGTVIEAQGTEAGVTTTKITNKKWTHWGELKGVQYEESGENNSEVVVILEKAIVTGGSLNLRMTPSAAGTKIASVPNGAVVDVVEKTNDVWWNIEYKGKNGFVMKNFLRDYTEETESRSGDTSIVLPEKTALELYNALKKALGK